MRNLQSTKIAIFFGGSSNERNISLDSARTCYDSIRFTVEEKNILLVFIDKNLMPFKILHNWIYSNTIEDFEDIITESKDVGEKLTDDGFNKIIKECDVLIPIIHGAFGEDGKLTSIFEKLNRKAFVGSSSKALALTLNKHKTIEKLSELGYASVKNVFFTYKQWENNKSEITHDIINCLGSSNKIIVKPNDCGSSDGITFCNVKEEEIDDAVQTIVQYSENVLVEEFIDGQEFSVIVIQDINGEIIPLIPTEIVKYKDFVYTRRMKYLPGAGAFHQTPISASSNAIDRIIRESKDIFKRFNLSDWARFDGFLLNGGTVIWSDLNGITGCGMDSFLFQQAALFGMDNTGFFRLLVLRALAKEDGLISQPQIVDRKTTKIESTKIAVIGGGNTSEKHVSRMSWLNVIIKLGYLEQLSIIPIFLDKKGRFWRVPRYVSLQHTTEEIEGIIENPKRFLQGVKIAEKNITPALKSFKKLAHIIPKEITIDEFSEFDYVFNALHGGIGEDGTLQRIFEKMKIKFNGSGSVASVLCSDKSLTNNALKKMNMIDFCSPKQKVITIGEINKKLGVNSSLSVLPDEHFEKIFKLYNEMKELLGCTVFVAKPLKDGCSTGVMVIQKKHDFINYINALLKGDKSITTDSKQIIVMPNKPTEVLFEEFIGGDNIIEMTVGVIGELREVKSLFPSETISKDAVLSLDEKFNKGIGPNKTPPRILSTEAINSIMYRIEKFANYLEIQNYARIDVLYNYETDVLYLIEVNNLPGLTSATIIFTQAMITPWFKKKPTEFLHHLIQIT